MKMPVRESNVFNIAPVLSSSRDFWELQIIPSPVLITPLCVLSVVGWYQYVKHEERVFYETDGGKHNDKHIKRTPKTPQSCQRRKKKATNSQRLTWVYYFLMEGLETIKALVVLIKVFKEDKITLICKRTLSSQWAPQGEGWGIVNDRWRLIGTLREADFRVFLDQLVSNSQWG